MRVLHWCMLGVTILLLVCEVSISQLCKSLITLVDGFHTLFILMRMALPPPQTASVLKPPPSSLDSPAGGPRASSSSAAPPSAPPAESSIKHLLGTQTTADGSTLRDLPRPRREAATLVNFHHLFSPKVSPPPVDCGLSYSTCRIQTVGTFISALVLASLCLSYIIEIISFSLEPHPVQRPLLLVAVGAVSLLHKMLVLGLTWDQPRDESAGQQAESHLEVNRKVLAEEETEGRAEPGRVLDDVSRVPSPVGDSLHNGVLVLCNPGTSSVPDTDSQTPQTRRDVRPHAAAPRGSGDCEVASRAADLSHSEDIAEVSEDNTCMGHLDGQNASEASPVSKSSHHARSRQWSLVPVIQGLCTSLLALINSLVMLLVGPQCPHSSGACRLLVYLDPGLSLLAVITLIATAMPQVHRYGLLLLQAAPPHICVSDLGRRIASVPGVQAVHDLHVWQLTESLTVASVHVHCHAGFPAHRCADLLSGVTKVLQSVGVSCCTVQPEFASCSGSAAGCAGGDASPVIHREDPSVPRPLACSLACGKACTGSMCCTPLEEETRGSVLAPLAGETKEELQTLVIENTFL